MDGTIADAVLYAPGAPSSTYGNNFHISVAMSAKAWLGVTLSSLDDSQRSKPHVGGVIGSCQKEKLVATIKPTKVGGTALRWQDES